MPESAPLFHLAPYSLAVRQLERQGSRFVLTPPA
jgi:hypothetical protein